MTVSPALTPPPSGDRWLGLSGAALPVADAASWVVEPACGAVVSFVGTARDHSTGRPDVETLEYEAYDEQVLPRLERVVDEIRARWPDVGRVVLLHRTGRVPVTEAAVVVVTAAPHREDAFESARFGIDTLKSTVPIWKREQWRDGESWGLEAQHIGEASSS